jgi:hypothetical protein
VDVPPADQLQRVSIGPGHAWFAARPLAPEHRRQQLAAVGVDRSLLSGIEIGAFIVVHEGGDISDGGSQLGEEHQGDLRSDACRSG